MRFPVDRIKIDRCFVRDILTDRAAAAVAGPRNLTREQGVRFYLLAELPELTIFDATVQTEDRQRIRKRVIHGI